MFSSGRRSAGSGNAARPSGKAGNLSFIGPDVVVSGNVTASTQIHIDGRIDGNVHCETLIQGDGGIIAGHITADAAHLAGLVDGTVKARMVTLEPTARVTGDVTYETLSIAAGAAIEGRLSRRQDNRNDKAPEIAPALAAPAEPAPAPAPSLVQPTPAKKPAKPGKGEEPNLLAGAELPAPAAANAR